MSTVTVSIPVQSYNARRYGKPWVAHITEFSGRPTLDFVSQAFNGNDQGGELILQAEVGEVFKAGQKDLRGNNTENNFLVARPDGTADKLDDPVEARKLWQSWKNKQ